MGGSHALRISEAVVEGIPRRLPGVWGGCLGLRWKPGSENSDPGHPGLWLSAILVWESALLRLLFREIVGHSR